MSYENCPLCGRLFLKESFYAVCQYCFEENETDFNKVRDYLYNHPNRNIMDVAADTGVNVEKIRQFLIQGRLISS